MIVGMVSQMAAEGARAEAITAIQDLLQSSSKPAVLIAKDWRVLCSPYAFADIAFYEHVARGIGCYVITVTRTEAGGQEHLLFMSTSRDLSESDCLGCLDAKYALPVWEGSK